MALTMAACLEARTNPHDTASLIEDYVAIALRRPSARLLVSDVYVGALSSDAHLHPLTPVVVAMPASPSCTTMLTHLERVYQTAGFVVCPTIIMAPTMPCDAELPSASLLHDLFREESLCELVPACIERVVTACMRRKPELQALWPGITLQFVGKDNVVRSLSIRDSAAAEPDRRLDSVVAATARCASEKPLYSSTFARNGVAALKSELASLAADIKSSLNMIMTGFGAGSKASKTPGVHFGWFIGDATAKVPVLPFLFAVHKQLWHSKSLVAGVAKWACGMEGMSVLFTESGIVAGVLPMVGTDINNGKENWYNVVVQTPEFPTRSTMPNVKYDNPFRLTPAETDIADFVYVTLVSTTAQS